MLVARDSETWVLAYVSGKKCKHAITNNRLIIALVILSPNVLHMFYFSFFLPFVKAEMLLKIKAGEDIGLAYSDRKRKLMLGVKDMEILNHEQAASFCRMLPGYHSAGIWVNNCLKKLLM